MLAELGSNTVMERKCQQKVGKSVDLGHLTSMPLDIESSLNLRRPTKKGLLVSFMRHRSNDGYPLSRKGRLRDIEVM
jgi:hypothetical protein